MAVKVKYVDAETGDVAGTLVVPGEDPSTFSWTGQAGLFLAEELNEAIDEPKYHSSWVEAAKDTANRLLQMSYSRIEVELT